VIRVFADLEAVSRNAAEILAAAARRAVAARGRFTVVLAGGETPRHTYELLAAPPFREELPWRQTHVFWGDERCVPANDPRSNALMARRALLDHVPVPPAQIHGVLAESPDSAPLPARLIRPTDGELVWLVDRAAAELVSL
jgi:6-phosphogluconolactonase